jgi:copper chaperone NosL
MKLPPLIVIAFGLALAACSGSGEEETAAPPPAQVTADATGHYCGMLLAEHEGPKGQIHLKSGAEPVWFSSVRDTIAFMRLPEEPDDIAAIYVNDMSGEPDWSMASPGPWIDAREAWFVVGSARSGGMGAPEAVPFGTEPAARAFAAEHGGEVRRLDAVPTDYVLGPTETPADGSAPAATEPAGHAGHAGG